MEKRKLAEAAAVAALHTDFDVAYGSTDNKQGRHHEAHGKPQWGLLQCVAALKRAEESLESGWCGTGGLSNEWSESTRDILLSHFGGMQTHGANVKASMFNPS